MGAKTVVLKLGRQGALLSDGQHCTPVAAHSVEAVDATGAGDCFDGAYRSCLATGADARGRALGECRCGAGHDRLWA